MTFFSLKNFSYWLIVVIIFFIFSQISVIAQINNYNKIFPSKVNEYIDTHIQNKEKYKFLYVMRWHKYKVYAIRRITYGIVWGDIEYYILYDGKQVRLPRPEERQQLRHDVRVYYNKSIGKTNRLITRKLSRNANKIMVIDDNTPPPQIPPALKQYTNKYMIKGDDVEFLYIMDWNGQHVYRTYWLRYGSIFNPLTVILYDGHIIRRPSEEEFKLMYTPMCQAYEKYLIELGRLHSKD